ncbi:FAD-binding oxidoreductase [Nocardia sp. CDC159]|uniref:D-lactate dehydrogenase (cytochrome) n=1 Tax=Nocardia pulmonis TaxID=2951408 RepID=A0A9X2ECM1_9NOCA|nr:MULTISPECIES: FAD-binding and (Fe-S)-binding domain-containing protein [Nocardia]MCM6778437.1 FAD-binding oxidoreductase [Nocardia pulmonis]MCM6791326.1 FAD-binding oxidoreductase [Nocardia sp. CDC159]
MSVRTRLRAALPIDTAAHPDRLAGALTRGTPRRLRTDLERLVGTEQVLSRPSDLVRYASDASPYRLIPQVVVVPRDERDVAAVLRYAREHHRAVTFRAAGTSLNGQSQGDDILLDVRRHFGGGTVEADGARLRARPGLIIAHANALLARHNRMLGPDPASSGSATVGGVVANNASGMSCGVARNSYHTVRSLRIVLASGTIVDTADPDADAMLAATEPDLVTELLAIKADLAADTALTARIRQKFAIKNTNGYRLDALLDGDTPTEILRGLMVCSQGTLGFLSEIVFDTVPFGRLHTTALLRCRDLYTATSLVAPMMAAGAHAAELMDAESLHAAATVPGAPAWLGEIEDTEAALLVEFRTGDPATLADLENAAAKVLAATSDSVRGEFTRDSATALTYWRVREGIFAELGATRPHGTVLLGEDVCVAPERVADAAVDLHRVLTEHGYRAAIQGHASAGNLHFALALDPSSSEQVDRYARCMRAVVSLILDTYDGSLKGEHATGRNMAPFLEREWGATAVEYMRRVKHALDPAGILNPGVVLNDDPDANIRHLKTMPTVDNELDRCIECGFCEPVCPSRDLTTTPRQRIVLQREIARQGEPNRVTAALTDDYDYDAVQTCAGDASCAIACPVRIDTGAAMKRLRHATHGARAERIAAWTARHWGPIERIARRAVGLGRVLAALTGDLPLRAITGLARLLFGSDLIPQWLPETPHPAPARLPATDKTRATAVYFPACINRIFGTPVGSTDEPTIAEAVVRLAERAGQPVWIPDDVIGTCCATIWHSKGYDTGNTLMANRLVDNLWRWSDHGRLPIIIDASSCTLGAHREILPYLTDENRHRHARLDIRDSITWARELLPHLAITTRINTAVIHPTCSMHHLDNTGDLATLAAAFADHVVEPIVATCCGFAGDRGYLHRELTEHATETEIAEIAATPADAYLSANRTCELGMQHASGHPYHSVLIHLEQTTRP